MASAFQCGRRTMARRPRAGNQRAFTRLFSGYGVFTGAVKRRNSANVPFTFASSFGSGTSRGENLYLALLQPEVGRRLVGVKLIAVGDDAPVEIDEELRRIVRGLPRLPAIAARPVLRIFQPPLQRTHHAIIVHRSKPVLPVIHPLCVARRHRESSSVTSGIVPLHPRFTQW